MTHGTIRDIRTGRALARTSSLTESFAHHIEDLLNTDEPFYLVYGRCRHSDVRALVTGLRETLKTVDVIFDARMPPDTVWAFAGEPHELGFAC